MSTIVDVRRLKVKIQTHAIHLENAFIYEPDLQHSK